MAERVVESGVEASEDGRRFYGNANVLGETYPIFLANRDDDALDGADGVCYRHLKKIVVLDVMNDEQWKKEPVEERSSYMKRAIRHELIHAFVNESGLAEDSIVIQGGWAMNEEMTDWIAAQIPKMVRTFKDLDLLGKEFWNGPAQT